MEQTNATGNVSRAVVVSTACAEADVKDFIGKEAYPYYSACCAFAPLLSRWGSLVRVNRPESRLDHALWRARLNKQEPMHVSFLPLHQAYLTQRAPNLAFAYCEFPDIPDSDLADNPLNNYANIANRLALLLTPNTFSRQSFLRAGVKAPIHLVPVPIPSTYFDLATWERGQRTVLDCPCHVFPQPEERPPVGVDPWAPTKRQRFSLRGGARQVYQDYLRPRVGAGLDRYLTLARRAAANLLGFSAEEVPIRYPVSACLELSGVVYTTIFNPLDPRKNWQDVLSAFLLALGDRENALLVVKLVTRARQMARAFHAFLRYYRKLGLRHRCKLVVVTSYLSEGQMLELAGASAYYIQATRAEGLGMPLQRFLAAGRPGISPAHTAMADYFCDDVGFVVAAHPEPACWPRDPERRHTTIWNRLVWQSLHDQLQNSFVVAEQNQAMYQAMACRARARLRDWAGAESVWPRLAAALDLASEAGQGNAATSLAKPLKVIARAS